MCDAGIPVHDRGYLLGDAKRNDVLTLDEVLRYGRDSFGDAEYVAVYGCKPADWYARGVRLLARTAVECTRDALADLTGRDVAAVAAAAPAMKGSVVVDPFAGSANTLYWIARHVEAGRAIGFELDDAVFGLTRENLEILDLHVELSRVGHEAGLKALRIPEDELLIVFVAPPWGDALDPTTGLDLRLTQPPVPAIVDLIADTFHRHKVLLAIQLHETVVTESLAAVSALCEWSAHETYDINAPGQNHGLLLGTHGWAP